MTMYSTQQPTLRVHNRFYDYLLEPSPRGMQGPNGEHLLIYQEILQEYVVPAINKHLQGVHHWT